MEIDPCTFLEGRMHHGQNMRYLLLFFLVTFFRGYKIVGAGFLRPRTNEQTSAATSCHRYKWLIMLDVEHWDVKSLQAVPRFYVLLMKI